MANAGRFCWPNRGGLFPVPRLLSLARSLLSSAS